MAFSRQITATFRKPKPGITDGTRPTIFADSRIRAFCDCFGEITSTRLTGGVRSAVGPDRGRWAAARLACLLVAWALSSWQSLRPAELARPSAVDISCPTHLSNSPQKEGGRRFCWWRSGADIPVAKADLGEQRDLAGLRATLRAVENHSSELSTANSKGKHNSARSPKSAKTGPQVREAEKAYKSSTRVHQPRAEHNAPFCICALESKIDELSAADRDQTQVKDNEQYLASDRDIRELMGARKLYIADVFDVDSGSRTRKPFGLVFIRRTNH